MKKNLGILLIFVCAIVHAQNQFKISGTLEGFKENSLVRIEKQNITIDSCYLKDKKFELKGELEDSPSEVYLIVGSDKDRKSTALFIGNEDVTIESRGEDFPYDVKTTGSKYDAERFTFAQQEKKLSTERTELLEKMWDLRDANKWNDSLQKSYWSREEPKGKIVKIDDELARDQIQFIEKNINSYYALKLLDIYKTEIPSEKIEYLLKKVNPTLSKSLYVKSIKSHLNNPDLKVGERFYDFTAYDKNQKIIKFSDYFNRKYVLLDFSTLYCGWCLEAIPVLEKIQDRNKDKIDVITFYVDKNIKGFAGLEKKHSKDWNILWDKEGRFSETFAKYKVFGTPTFYLFEPNGNLIKIFDGYSEDMAEEIEKLMK